MTVTITILPQSATDEYKLEIEATGAGPLVIIQNQVSPDGLTRHVVAQQNTNGTDPVETDTFTKLATEVTIKVKVVNSNDDEIGNGQVLWQ